MFYIVHEVDRILVLAESPVQRNGKLRKSFVEYYYGDAASAASDIVSIGGPYTEFQISAVQKLEAVKWDKDNRPTALYFDEESGKYRKD